MDPDTVLRVAHDQAMQYPSVAVGHPFGPEYSVYKVRGRMFMMAYELRGTPSLNLKIDPLDGEVLRDAYAEITPGYHMNKLHWITVAGAGASTEAGASTDAGGTGAASDNGAARDNGVARDAGIAGEGDRLDAELLHELALESDYRVGAKRARRDRPEDPVGPGGSVR